MTMIPNLQVSNAELLKNLLGQSDKILAKRCRTDFYFFVKQFWHAVITEDPVYNWHIKEICLVLQEYAFRVIQRKPKKKDIVINVSPGSTKSTIITQMYPVWCWIAELPNDLKEETLKANEEIGVLIDMGITPKRVKGKLNGADLRFITGSHRSDLSLEHADYSKDILNCDRFQKYFPEIRLRHDKKAKSNYKNTKMGARVSTSTGAMIMGFHAHFIIIDDPIDPKGTNSDVERVTANDWLRKTLSTRKVNKLITLTILVMQRLHEDDPTGDMLAKGEDKIHHICLPADDSYPIKPAKYKKFYVDGLFDPIRLNWAAIEEMKQNLGSYGFAGQGGQAPAPREGGMFDPDTWEHVGAIPVSKNSIRVRGWDLAGTSEAELKKGQAKPAYTAGVGVEWVDGIFYVFGSSRFRASSNERNIKMRNVASGDGIKTIQDFPQDPGSAGKDTAKAIAKALVGFRVKYSTESGDKVTRADPVADQGEAGNIKIVKGTWNKDFKDELKMFPNGKYKDQVDGFSRAFSRIVRMIALMQNLDLPKPTAIQAKVA